MSAFQFCFAVLAVVFQVHAKGDKGALKLELNLMEPMAGESLCTRDTVMVSDGVLSINLFVDRKDTESLKALTPKILSSIAQELVFQGYGNNPYKTPCSQMYYLVGNLATYEMLTGTAETTKATDKLFRDGYQLASDIAFKKLTKVETDTENNLNKEVLPKLDAKDFINMYNGHLSESTFFNKFRAGIPVSEGDKKVQADFMDSFNKEEAAFKLAQPLLTKFLDAMKKAIGDSDDSS